MKGLCERGDDAKGLCHVTLFDGYCTVLQYPSRKEVMMPRGYVYVKGLCLREGAMSM